MTRNEVSCSGVAPARGGRLARTAAALVLLASPARLATAEEGGAAPSARLEWHRAPGADRCTSAEALKDAVELRLERRVFTSTEADFLIRGRIEPGPQGAGWRVVFDMYDAGGARVGERHVTGSFSACRDMDASLALVLALMVESPRERAALRLPDPRAESPRLEGEIGGSVALGLLPGIGIGSRLGTGAVLSSGLHPRAALAIWLPTRREEGGAGAHFTAWSADAGLCWLPGRGRLELEPCAGLLLARVSADPFGLAGPRAPAPFVLAVQGGAAFTLRLTAPLYARFEAHAAVPVLSARFLYIAGNGAERTLWDQWPVLPIGRVAVGMRFP